MSARKLLYIVSRAPYSNAVGQEALDAALIGASFEQDVSLLFLHDGVFQLVINQGSDGSGLKEFTKAYRALEDFGIDKVFCHDLSLAARGLTNNDLMRDVTTLTGEQLKSLVASSARVFTF